MLPIPVIETAQQLPGVAAVDVYHGVTIPYRGRQVWLAAVRLDQVLLGHGAHRSPREQIALVTRENRYAFAFEMTQKCV